MGRFPLPLNVQLLDGGELAQLLTEFIYQAPAGPMVRVPAGFETDFASVRPLRNMAVGLLALGIREILLLAGFPIPESQIDGCVDRAC